MENAKAVYEFAEKWLKKFQHKDYREVLGLAMGDDCQKLGFIMDCGSSFEEKYGKASCEYNKLKLIIDKVDDITLLGSAVYSRWRYFSHWALKHDDILIPDNQNWFILALRRLRELASEKLTAFKGAPQKIRIVSNRLCFGILPKVGYIVEQHITVNTEGRVWYSDYTFESDCFGKYKKVNTKNFKTDKKAAAKILNTAAKYFSVYHDEKIVMDVGSWNTKITNTDEVVFDFNGAFFGDYIVDGIDICNLIREALKMDGLFLFDGMAKPDPINRITVDYHRLSKIKTSEIPKDLNVEYATWEYTEKLIIDRKTESIELIQNIGSGCTVSHKYKVQDGVPSLLDELSDDLFFSFIPGEPDDVVENPDETRDYTITIDSKKAARRVISGSFDANGLPVDFGSFAKTVLNFMQFYEIGEILNSSVYKKKKRSRGDYVFCSVTFKEYGKSYYYIADDEFEIDDFVKVPVGNNGNVSTGKIVNIEFFTKDDAPLPIEKTKHIIGKVTKDDILLPTDNTIS